VPQARLYKPLQHSESSGAPASPNGELRGSELKNGWKYGKGDGKSFG